MIKREPLLADKFLALTYGKDELTDLVPEEYFESTRSNLLLAKRFVLDEQATVYCADLIKRAPRIIADAQDFAIPPFERTYIEIPFKPWFETITGRPGDADGDTRVGYLIVGNVVRCFSENPDGLCVSPLEYHLHHPLTVEEEVKYAHWMGTSRIGLDTFYWGELITSFGTITCTDGKHRIELNEWDKAGVRSLRANHGFSIHLPNKALPQIPAMMEGLHEGSNGDLRNIIGLLIFLNRTSQVRYEREIPFKPQMVNRKSVNLLKHRVITIKVDPIPKLLKLGAGSGIQRRLHDVRGHLCHNEIARTNFHDHDWQESEGDHLRWFCECGGKRWWRKEHHRGHEERGIVTSEYTVTKNE